MAPHFYMGHKKTSLWGGSAILDISRRIDGLLSGSRGDDRCTLCSVASNREDVLGVEPAVSVHDRHFHKSVPH